MQIWQTLKIPITDSCELLRSQTFIICAISVKRLYCVHRSSSECLCSARRSVHHFVACQQSNFGLLWNIHTHAKSKAPNCSHKEEDFEWLPSHQSQSQRERLTIPKLPIVVTESKSHNDSQVANCGCREKTNNFQVANHSLREVESQQFWSN